MFAIFLRRDSVSARILLVSLWMLFLEIWLIRWVSTEIRIFAYVNNLVLLSCFLGIGAGCAFPNVKPRLSVSFVALAGVILAVHAWPFTLITDLLSVFSDSIIWFKAGGQWSLASVVQGVVLTICMFSLIAVVFFPLGQLLGGLFNACSNVILAYSVNIVGSIAGIWLFAWMSFLSTPPLFWFIAACIPAVMLLDSDRCERIAFALVCIFCLTIMSVDQNGPLYTVWSPYQKLTVNADFYNKALRGFNVRVNNVGYMGLLNLSKDFVKEHFGTIPEAMDAYAVNQYEIPYRLKSDAKEILIVGSGGGNDVAGALRNGIANVDAVEIDPMIYQLGLELHPEKPYADPRVHVTIDDARSFFHSMAGKKQYDIIIFGLLDSHTLGSSYNNIRLDHYVYTRESLQHAKALLKPGGLLSLAFEVQTPWIYSRFHGLLTEVFGHPPIAFSIRSPGQIFGWGGVIFIESLDPLATQAAIQNNALLQQLLASNALEPNPAPVKLSTDDWPYLYLEKAGIPEMYLCIILSLAVLFVAVSQTTFKQGKSWQWQFFFLGAGFMLLEFQNITKSSLLFGATWLVNVYTITAIMIFILLANYLVYKMKFIKPSHVYALLFASVIAIYILPLDSLQFDNKIIKGIIVCGIFNIPVLFGSILFIHAFHKTTDKSAALASNLFGASLGGMLESAAFITGIRALMLAVALLYLGSYLASRKTLTSRQ